MTQRCPVAHALTLPQWQAPAVHLSAVTEEHAVQAPPPVPQNGRLGVCTQVLVPVQHPDAHAAALQTQVPPEQS